MAGEGIEAVPTPYSPYGIRINERISLGNCIAYQEGAIEVQDEASQLAAILCDVKPEHKIMDYCCGAGGKSLMCFQCVGDDEKIVVGIFNVVRLPADNECADPFAAEFGYVSLTVVRTGGEGNEYCLIVIPRKTAAVGKQSANGALRVARLFSSYDFGDSAK